MDQQPPCGVRPLQITQGLAAQRLRRGWGGEKSKTPMNTLANTLAEQDNATQSLLTPSEAILRRRSAQQLQAILWRLKRSGLTWREVGNHFGATRGVAHLIASGRWVPKGERVQEILNILPSHIFWHGPDELEGVVLRLLQKHGRLTGQELGRRCATTDRTIRVIIKRLRERGIKISASMSPPRGYRLEEADERGNTQEG